MIKFIQEIRGKNPKEKRNLTLKSIYTLIFCLVWGIGGVKGQTSVFSDDFSANQSATYTSSGAIEPGARGTEFCFGHDDGFCDRSVLPPKHRWYG